MDANEHIEFVRRAMEEAEFVKLTFSKPRVKQSDLQNVYVRPVQLKGQDRYQFTYRFRSRDEVKNYALQDSLALIQQLFTDPFMIMTLTQQRQVDTFRRNKKGIHHLSKAASHPSPDVSHDHIKNTLVPTDRPFLQSLGVTDENGRLVPKMADKYRQISRFVEIASGLIPDTDPISIVDMGSGKGYLTFALYDYLCQQDIDCMVIGIEQRKDLVQLCNEVAEKHGFDNLVFQESSIGDVNVGSIDVLIALHACDTATDDAIHYAIRNKAKTIITAPCCHKQVRKDAGDGTDNPLLQHGIFQERQFEMVTDTIRALLMESRGYKSRIFEFVSNEHTRKNVMLVGEFTNKQDSDKLQLVRELKKQYDISTHYLEELLD